MYSKLTTESDYNIIKSLFDVRLKELYVPYARFGPQDLKNNSIKTRFTYMDSSLYAEGVKDVLSECNHNIQVEYTNKFREIGNILRNTFKSYAFPIEKILLGKTVVLSVGPNVLVKTDQHYKLAENPSLYAGIYNGYQLLNMKDVVGGTLAYEDSTIIDDEPNFKWLPYLYSFTLPTFGSEDSEDDKFVSFLSSKMSKEDFNDFIASYVSDEMEHPNLERYKVIVDLANVAVKSLYKSLVKQKDIVEENAISILDDVKEEKSNIALYESASKSFNGLETVICNPDDFAFIHAQYEQATRNFGDKLYGTFFKSERWSYGSYNRISDYSKSGIARNLVHAINFGYPVNTSDLKNYWWPSDDVLSYIKNLNPSVTGYVHQFIRLIDLCRNAYHNDTKHVFEIKRLHADGSKDDMQELNELMIKLFVDHQEIEPEDFDMAINLYKQDGVIGMLGITELEHPSQTKMYPILVGNLPKEEPVKLIDENPEKKLGRLRNKFYVKGISDPVSKEEYPVVDVSPLTGHVSFI